MVAIVVGTHGKFSKEIIKSGEMIFGKQENVGYVTFEPGESADGLVGKYEELIESLDCEDGVLFMVDLFGGSPYNAASRIAINSEKMDIVTGVSLPMLLEVFGVKSFSSVEELANTALSTVHTTVKSFKQTITNMEEEEL